MAISRLAASLALALLAAPHAALAKSAKFETAYVILGPQGPVARAVYKNGAVCPSIVVDGAAQPMSVRALPESGISAVFPVLVCEFLVPSSATTAVLEGHSLPLPAAALASVAVLGDTGCRLKADKKKNAKNNDDEDDDDDDTAGNKAPAGKFQDCDKASQWPFSKLAGAIAARKPQVVVHVGDYIYRESPCPKGDQGCKGSPYGDNWATWKADFFTPAASLLTAAPWIATRGNHEICKRAGDGFMLFLDPTLSQNQKPPACIDLIPQFTVTAGGQQFIVFDSSNADDACPKSGCDSAPYAQQFAAMKPANGAWFVSHRPIWGFKNKGDPLNDTLQAALAQWRGRLPPGITLALAGHIHIWEVLSFADARTPQFVLGNGGTLLTKKIKAPLTGRSVGGTTVACGNSIDKWGFTIFTPAPGTANWTASYYSVKGNDKLTCSVTPAAVACP
jgi:hypothetical protein